jgi:hypothetical protein
VPGRYPLTEALPLRQPKRQQHRTADRRQRGHPSEDPRASRRPPTPVAHAPCAQHEGCGPDQVTRGLAALLLPGQLLSPCCRRWVEEDGVSGGVAGRVAARDHRKGRSLRPLPIPLWLLPPVAVGVPGVHRPGHWLTARVRPGVAV